MDDGDHYSEHPGREGGSTLLGVAATIAVLTFLAAAGVFAWVLLRDDHSAATDLAVTTPARVAASPATASSSGPADPEGTGISPGAPEPGSHDTASEQPLPRPQRSTTPATSARSGNSNSNGNGSGNDGAGAPASYPAGADRSGWTGTAAARCNAGDPAAMIGRTDSSTFSLCTNPDNGRFYYRGYSGGAGIEISDPTVSRGAATVTNGAVTYSISPSTMSIYEGGRLISQQPMQAFWSR